MNSGTCKHFRGIQHKLCLAGIDARNITGGDDFGWAGRMPCFKKNDSAVVCESYCEPTEKELAEHEERIQLAIKKMKMAGPLIAELKQKHKDGGSGEVECPVCGGVLRYAVAASNNHVRGKCETEGCLNWIE